MIKAIVFLIVVVIPLCLMCFTIYSIGYSNGYDKAKTEAEVKEQTK